MFADTPSTNAPVRSRTQNLYSTTFTGPIKQNRQLQDATRNQSMAQAAFAGDTRQFIQQAGRGVGAGSAMAAYRGGVQADSEAGKGFAQAQQDLFNRFADTASSGLQFLERLSGERGWLRDLLLDAREVSQREREAAAKRFVDENLGQFERQTKEAVAEESRKTTRLSGWI